MVDDIKLQPNTIILLKPVTIKSFLTKDCEYVVDGEGANLEHPYVKPQQIMQVLLAQPPDTDQVKELRVALATERLHNSLLRRAIAVDNSVFVDHRVEIAKRDMIIEDLIEKTYGQSYTVEMYLRDNKIGKVV